MDNEELLREEECPALGCIEPSGHGHTPNRTAPLKELLAAAARAVCKCPLSSMHYRHHEDCKFMIAVNAREKLITLGFRRVDGEWPALDALIACSEALEKQGLLIDSLETVLAGNALSLVDEDAAQSFIEEIATLRREALAKVDALNA